MSRDSASKHVLSDVGGLFLTRSIGLLPHRAALALGAGFGKSLCAALPKKRRRIERNLVAAGREDARAGAFDAVAHVGRTMAEMSWMLWRSPEDLDAVTEITGLDELRAAVARGRGVLLASAHVGNWELGVRAAARCGTPVHAIARALGTPRVESAIARCRESGGIRTLTRGSSGTSVAAYRALRRGEILACMMDRMSGGRRLTVPFLGAYLRMPVGPAILARRAGAAIVVGGTHRSPDGRNHVVVREIPGGSDVFAGESAEDTARRVGAELNAIVSTTPEQWYWIYRRPASDGSRARRGGAEATVGAPAA